ncbi:MAG: hypothetical protein JOZ18_19695 [Chloroflexi bacterium]|nr:hypothetical protein [Chloroflexota bacterium]
MNKTLFITGATGFIGHETVIEAVKAGWQVKGLVHAKKHVDALREIGAIPCLPLGSDGDTSARGDKWPHRSTTNLPRQGRN